MIDNRQESSQNSMDNIKLNEISEQGDLLDSSSINQENKEARSNIYFDGFSIRFEDLITWVPRKKTCTKEIKEKVILKGLTAEIKAGSMTAIIGPSGSGKTTLMNFLSCRQNESQMFRNYCQFYMNNTKIVNLNEFKNIIGYVLQDDIMDETQTPRYILELYAKLRGYKDYIKRADDVLKLLFLEECANTVVGDHENRGISGGERKRTNIGIELISNPNLLFLDEPTTGLDSSTAFEIMNHLFKLKQRGITIISTIHSPSNEILSLFDQVLVLADGMLIYDGPPGGIEERLSNLNYELPPKTAPIDYFMQVIDKNDLKLKLEDEGKDPTDSELNNEFHLMMKEFERRQDEDIKLEEIDDKQETENYTKLRRLAQTKNKKINVFRQTGVLLANSFLKTYTNVDLMVTFLTIYWFLSIIILVLFIDLGSIEEDTIVAIQNRSGLHFIVIINTLFSGLNICLASFLPRKPHFMKDKQSKLYDDGPFFISEVIVLVPFFFACILVNSILVYFILDVNDDKGINFFYLFINHFFGSFICGMAFGIIIGAVTDSLDQANQLFPIVVVPQFLVSGFIVNFNDITWPLKWFGYIAPMRYNFQALISLEFENADRYINSCNHIINKGEADEASVPITISEKRCNPFEFYDFKPVGMLDNFYITFGLSIFFLILSFVIFKLKYKEKKTRYSFDQEIIEEYTRVRNKAV